MYDVSYFKSAFSKYPYATVELTNIFAMIKDGSFKDIVEDYRANKTRELKQRIPAYSVSGSFSVRNAEGCEKYNGIICIDIDKKDNMDIDLDNVCEKLRKAKSVLAYHKSVGGEGLAVYILTNNNKIEQHEGYFNSICDDFKNYLGVTCDSSCSDISRLRFVSYDPRGYVCMDCKPHNVDVRVQQKSDRALNPHELREALNGLSFFISDVVASGVDITSDYADWSRIAFILADAYEENGRDMFHSLSQSYHKYSYTETNKMYDSALRRRKGGSSVANINTFYYICSRYGLKRKR